MEEKTILKEKVKTTKSEVEKKPKKRNYKSKNKKEVNENLIYSDHDLIVKHTTKEDLDTIVIKKTIGKYCIGSGKGYCIHLEKKPNWLHRKCMELFLGWKWVNNKK